MVWKDAYVVVALTLSWHLRYRGTWTSAQVLIRCKCDNKSGEQMTGGGQAPVEA